VPTTVAAPQSGDDARGHRGKDELRGRTIDLGPFGKVVVLPPGHLDKTHGRSATPTTEPQTTTPTTEPHTTTPTTSTTQPQSTTTQPRD
jgi:hypothetical protein